MPTNTLSPIKKARRAKIVTAAEHLFVTDGYRATTMEAVARAAGMSKVTVYGYFHDKDALFDAVAETIADDMQQAFTNALARETVVGDRVVNALIAKHQVVRDRVRKSRFAAELFAIKNRASARRFHELDQGFIAQITAALSDAGHNNRDARKLAEVLFAASQGIANAALTASLMRDQMVMLKGLVSDGREPG